MYVVRYGCLDKEISQMTGVEKIIKSAGSEAALGDVMGVTQQAVSKWKRQGFLPPGRVEQALRLFRVERRELIDPKLLELVG